jgi:hypothetical protein
VSFETLSLEPFFTTLGATDDAHRQMGRLNAWGNSFPAEELPFGATLKVGDVSFCLPDKTSESLDMVEPLGQTIQLSTDRPVAALALLCCGEMGDQLVELRAVPADGGPTLEILARVPGFAVVPSEEPEPGSHRFTHLHYPGDYDLGLLTGALFCTRHELERPTRLARLELGTNPLVHIAALTLIHPD